MDRVLVMNSRNHLHHHLHPQPPLSLSHMVDQTQTQTLTLTHSQPQSHPHHAHTTTTTTTTQAPPPPPPPPTSTITTPPQNSTSSKIPFRPRKIRKLSSDATPDNSNTKSLQQTKENNQKITTTTNKIPAQQLRIPPRIVSRTLSTEGEISHALRHLRSSDPNLARVIDIHQPPSFDSFHPPFLALSKSILYQQLAFKAGTSIYTRFVSLCGGEAGVVPEAVLALSPHQLRQIGVSARKASYLHDLANKYRNGILSDTSIVDMDDKSLFTMLTMVKGIGSWSVHMFMIFSLHRPDVLPVGDLGVRKGVQILYGLEQLPRPSQMDQLCEKWRPYRSVASWYMWRIAEAKGAPAMVAAVDPSPSQQPQQQSQLIDQINSIANLGACGWGQ